MRNELPDRSFSQKTDEALVAFLRCAHEVFVKSEASTLSYQFEKTAFANFMEEIESERLSLDEARALLKDEQNVSRRIAFEEMKYNERMQRLVEQVRDKDIRALHGKMDGLVEGNKHSRRDNVISGLAGLVLGLAMGPFTAVILKHPADRFDRWWNAADYERKGAPAERYTPPRPDLVRFLGLPRPAQAER